MSKSAKKKRLDLVVHELRPELSRSRIQAEIMAGNVIVNGLRCDKPGSLIKEDVRVTFLEPENPYVSRGGLKLEGALADLEIEVKDLTVLDVGASTGGFTDCLLQHGAAKVYALDVGYGQLDLKLRTDQRVVVLERLNIKNTTPHHLPTVPDFAVVDVSFISLQMVLPVLRSMQIRLVLALVKPQFEAGRVEVSRGKGVIRDPQLHCRILLDTIESAFCSGYYMNNLTYSKWPGPKGNIEYFMSLVKNDGECKLEQKMDIEVITEVVQKAHLNLKI